MPRVLTPEHKAAMAAGREKAAAVKRAIKEQAEDLAYASWMAWLREESEAYARYRIAALDNNDAAGFYHDAWLAKLRAMPKPPDDKTFKRMRGAIDEAESQEDATADE